MVPDDPALWLLESRVFSEIERQRGLANLLAYGTIQATVIGDETYAIAGRKMHDIFEKLFPWKKQKEQSFEDVVEWHKKRLEEGKNE